MRDYLIQNNDREELEYTLVKVEELYEIKFYENELRHVTTIGELVVSVIFKIDDDHSINCTTQRAFYKLRKAIAEVLKIERKDITPKTFWVDILPEKDSLYPVQKIEEILGFQLSLLRIPVHVYIGFITLCILSLYVVSLHFVFGIIGVIVFITGFWLLTVYSNFAAYQNIITIETVGDVAEKIAKKHYLQPSRKYDPIDKIEVERHLIKLFCDQLGLDNDELITT